MSLAVDTIIRSSILLAVGLAALWLLRKQPAALRHWVLAAALAIAATQPVMKQIVPRTADVGDYRGTYFDRTAAGSRDERRLSAR
jgi:hypothetical protein